ncbi:uncharacterized protein LOC129582261 [Paramacrobiotus metropolitanus]|uniref:uncharacterized protein LOC129582261 n=1 Tax=Paramacrobiotus metropolitanus TaxID=2943436 RepID=UPI0024459BAF|nr:uncharacterized protein LOC129582261 [Paramacrobiotus metropolitanus]
MMSRLNVFMIAGVMGSVNGRWTDASAGTTACNSRAVDINAVHKECVEAKHIAMWCPDPSVPIRPPSADFVKTFRGTKNPRDRLSSNRPEYLITKKYVEGKNGQCELTRDIEQNNVSIRGAFIELKEANNGMYCCYDAGKDKYGSCWNINVTAESCTDITPATTNLIPPAQSSYFTGITKVPTIATTENLGVDMDTHNARNDLSTRDNFPATTDSVTKASALTACEERIAEYEWRARNLKTALGIVVGLVLLVFVLAAIAWFYKKRQPDGVTSDTTSPNHTTSNQKEKKYHTIKDASSTKQRSSSTPESHELKQLTSKYHTREPPR